MSPRAGGAGSPAPAHAAAVIDVGSHSVLLLTVALAADGRAVALDEALASTRLGSGLRPGEPLDPEAWRRTRAAVVGFADRARAAGATPVWAFATGAVRDAADGPAFADDLGQAARIPVEILSGEREARLAYAAVPVAGPHVVADVGGRTTELTLGRDEDILEAVSLPLGALALTERFLQEEPPLPAARAALAAAVDDALAACPLPGRARSLGARLAASGGTATTLGALDLGLRTYDPSRVHGHALGATGLATLTGRLATMPRAERAALGPLDDARAAILPAGALVLARLVVAVGVSALQVSDHGVRHAYLRERLAAFGVAVDLSRLWTRTSPA